MLQAGALCVHSRIRPSRPKRLVEVRQIVAAPQEIGVAAAARVLDALTIHDESDGIVHLKRSSAQKRLHAQIASALQLGKVLPRIVSAALEVFATLDVCPIDLVHVVEFDAGDIVPKIFLGVPVLLAVAHMQDSFLLVEHVGPGSADVGPFGEDVRFLMPFPVAVALRTPIVRKRAELFHCRMIFLVAHTGKGRMSQGFGRLTRLECEVFVHDRAPSRGMLVDQNAQHPCEIVVEMPC